MVKFFDKLNTLRAVIVVLALFLVVDSFLFYRYRLMDAAAASAPASAPSLEAVPAAAKEDDAHLSEQEDEDDSGDEESGDEAVQPDSENDSEKQGMLEAHEAEAGPVPVATPDPPPASTPSAADPTPAITKD